jgi:hypothetical protein
MDNGENIRKRGNAREKSWGSLAFCGELALGHASKRGSEKASFHCSRPS